MLQTLVEVEHLVAPVDACDLRGAGLYILSKVIEFELLSFFKLHLQQSDLVFEVGNDQVVPTITHLSEFLFVRLFEGHHFVRVFLVCVDAALLLLENAQFFQALTGLLGFI